MAEECKSYEKKASDLEKEDPTSAISAYKQAAICYNKYGKTKNCNSCLEKAAKILRDNAKSIDEPNSALDVYKQSANLYIQIGKKIESEKVMSEAYKKFIDSSKNLTAEARKIEDPEVAEQKLSIAADYAKKGYDEELSNSCWIDSAEKFRKKAASIENPRAAFEVYKHAIQNYKKGSDEDSVNKILIEAGEVFYKKGTEIEKSKKDLVLAIDNYVQAKIIFRVAKNEEKMEVLSSKVTELCEFIGMDLEYITMFLEANDLKEITI